VLPSVRLPSFERSRKASSTGCMTSPLLSFLGVSPEEPRFEGHPTYPGPLDAPGNWQPWPPIPAGPQQQAQPAVWPTRILAPQSTTVTHTLWAMLGPGAGRRASSRPIATNPVALDLVIDASPVRHVFSGPEAHADGTIRDPV